MEQYACSVEKAETTNSLFEEEVRQFLSDWVEHHEDDTLLQFDQPLNEYLGNDALRDFFLNTAHPIQKLLKNQAIADHLGRCACNVYFDPVSGDPLLAPTEQRIYNFARRMDSERMHIPFRSIHPNKQTEIGDNLDLNAYPAESQEIRYNSGNHFISRPANDNVFNENSKRCIAKAEGNLHIFFRRGFLEDRLQDVKVLMAEMHEAK